MKFSLHGAIWILHKYKHCLNFWLLIEDFFFYLLSDPEFFNASLCSLQECSACLGLCLCAGCHWHTGMSLWVTPNPSSQTKEIPPVKVFRIHISEEGVNVIWLLWLRMLLELPRLELVIQESEIFPLIRQKIRVWCRQKWIILRTIRKKKKNNRKSLSPKSTPEINHQ